MSEHIYRGIISFVHYEKHFATIEYKHGGKTKSVNCKTKAAGEGQKLHYFRVGDEVNFKLKLTDRGDKMMAHHVQFLFNAGLEKLIQRARHENRFSGYLKQVDDALFVKEQETYLFFPLKLSTWENQPGTQSFNAPVTFKLVNLEKPRQIAAELFFQVFKPEYRLAQKAKEEKTVLPATVTKVSPYAVYVGLFEGKLQSKINLPAPGFEQLSPGDVVDVVIIHLSGEKIVVQKAKR